MSSRKKRTLRGSARRAALGPQNWFTQIGREQAAKLLSAGKLSPDGVGDYLERRRLEQKYYLRNTVKELRKVFKGFDSASGYDLNNIERWPAARARFVQEYGARLHDLKSTPHLTVTPRSQRAKKALRHFTRQVSSRQKAYIVHTEKPETSHVSVTRDGRVEIAREVKGATLVQRFYFFLDMTGKQPATFRGMRAALKKMLPDMPDGYYTLYTEPHGSIGLPHNKQTLMDLLVDYENRYEVSHAARKLHEDFAEVILGFQFQGTRDMAIQEYRERQERRSAHKRAKEQQRRERRRYVGQYRRRR